MAHAKDSGAEGGAFPRAQQDRLFSTRPASAKPAKGGRDRSAGPKGKDGEGKARGRSTGTGEQRKGKEGGERRGSSRPSALVASASASGGIPTIRFADELSFKRTKPGTVMMCRVRRVTARQVILALPHGLTGSCNAAHVNPAVARALRKKGQAAAGEDDDEDVSDLDAEDPAEGEGEVAVTDPGLVGRLTPGQFVLGVAVNVGGATQESAAATPALALAASLMNANASRNGSGGHSRIVMSLAPEAVNKGVAMAQLRTGSLVSGYIASVEDHGYVVATGVAEVTSAFLPFANCDGTAGQAGTTLVADDEARPAVGTPVWCTVAEVHRGAGTLTLSCKATGVSKALSNEPSHTIFTLKPGMRVAATVDKVLANGLAVTFLAFFKATIHLNHLPAPAHALWADGYTPGTVLDARVLYVDVLDKTIALSAAPHVVSLGATTPESPLGTGGPAFDAEEGAVIEAATVVRVDPGAGMLIAWASASAPAPATPKPLPAAKAPLDALTKWGRTAYVHISRVADEKVDHIERLYRPGAPVRARLIAFHGVEGVGVAATKPSVVNASVLNVSDVKPGDVVTATVVKVFTDESAGAVGGKPINYALGKGTAAVVKLAESVTAHVATLHMADVLPSKPFASAKARAAYLKDLGLSVGAAVRVRVLTVDAATGRVAVTMKKTLVDTTLPFLASYEDAQAALLAARKASTALAVQGVVTAVRDSGLLVALGGGLLGTLSCEDLVANGLVPKDTAVSVKSPDGVHEHTIVPVPVLTRLFRVGQVLKVRLVSVFVSGRRIKLSSNTAPNAATLLADKAAVAAAPEPAALPAPGCLVAAEVVSLDAARERLLVRVTRITAVGAAGNDDSDHEDDDSEDEVATTKAVGALDVPVLAELPLAHLTDVPGALPPSAVPAAGTPLTGLVVLATLASTGGKNRPRLTVSGKPLLRAAAAADSGAGLALPASLSTLRPGLVVAGYVASVTAFGAFVRFLDGLTGLAPRFKWPADRELAVGETIVGAVESVAPEAGRFTVSLAAEALTTFLPGAELAEALPASVFAAAARAVGEAAAPASACATGSTLAVGVRQLIAAADAAAAPANDAVSRSAFAVGAIIAGASVRAVSDAGAVLELPGGEGGAPVTALLTPAPAGLASGGAPLTVRVLDVDAGKGIVIVSPAPAAAGTGTPASAKKGKGGKAATPAAGGAAPAAASPAAIATGAPVGKVVKARVLLAPADKPYVVAAVPLGAGAGEAVALVATAADGVGAPLLAVGAAAPAHACAVGQDITAVVVQTPAHAAAAGSLDCLLLCDATPATMGAVNPTKAGKAAAAAAGGNAPAARDVSTLAPGAVVTAIVKASTKKAKAEGSDAEDEEDEELEEDEEDEASAHGFPALKLRLLGVSGKYFARLSFAEVADLDAYSGKAGAPAEAAAAYAALADAGTPFTVKVANVTVLPARSKTAQALVAVAVTARPRDLALPEGQLACPRLGWADAAGSKKKLTAVPAPATALAVTPAQAAAVGPASLHATTGAPRAGALRQGAVAWGVVEAADPRGWLWVGLGGSLRARVDVLECGDADDIRDPSTGALRPTPAAAAALSFEVLRSTTHPPGSVVPLVVLSVDADRALITGSIRRAHRAMEVAAVSASDAAAGAAVGTGAKAAKRQKLAASAADAASASAFDTATNAVATWLAEGDAATAAAPGSLTLALVFGAGGKGAAGVIADGATHVRARLPGGAYARVCISQARDKQAWQSNQLASSLREGDVRVAAVLPGASGHGDIDLSLRPSVLAMVSAPPAEAPQAGKKRKAGASDAPAGVAGLLEKALAREASEATTPGALVSGFIIGFAGAGLLVRLTNTVAARVSLSNLSDAPVRNVKAAFPAGKLVTGRVLSVDADARRYELSLKRSDVGAEGGKDADAELLTFSDLAPGMILEGTVGTVAEFGVFVNLDGTTKRPGATGASAAISALCHVSEVSDAKGAATARGALGSTFAAGDRVRVVVTEVDAKGRRVSVSMRPSRLAEAEAAADEDEDDDEDAEDEDVDFSGSEEDEEDMEDDEDEEEEGSEEEEEDAAPRKAGGIYSHLSDDEDSEEEEDDDEDDGVAAAAASKKAAPSAASKARARMADEYEMLLSDNEDADDGSSDEESGARAGSAAAGKAAKRSKASAAAAAEEAETARREARLLSGAADVQPESIPEFERLIGAHPNSSLAWLKYMAWHVSKAELHRARATAERALETINYREEAEKLAVWIGWMNLEAAYGDDASLAKVFGRAAAAADPRAVHNALLGIYQRAGDARAEEASRLFAVAAKKFGREDKELWASWAAFCFRRGKAEEARGLLARALAVLPRADHVPTILQFALLEYRFAARAKEAAAATADVAGAEFGLGEGAGTGSEERGRTLFESLLGTAPKRLDIWSVFLDQEIAAFVRRHGKAASLASPPAPAPKPGATAEATKIARREAARVLAAEVAAIRLIFDRALSHRSSSKKTKFLLKKYLAFEAAHGDAKGAARVQDIARTYVESQVGARGAAAMQDDEDDE